METPDFVQTAYFRDGAERSQILSQNPESAMSEPIYDLAGKRIWVAGHRGMVGSALVRRLQSERCEVITVTREELDLRRQHDVEEWLRAARPQAIIMAAARVG